MREGASVTKRTATLLATCLLAVMALGDLAGCRALPAPREKPIPRLQLGQTSRDMTLRAYGTPKVETPYHLWYVGPEPTSLTHGTTGWMTLLTYDSEGMLICQEFLSRTPEQGYMQLHYWIKGDLSKRDRDNDLDRRMLPRAVELAQLNSSYRITWNEQDRFVMARLLPSENEPVVVWQSQAEDERSEIRLDAKTLTGRDEPLAERIDGVIAQRMLLIEVTLDKQAYPSAATGSR